MPHFNHHAVAKTPVSRSYLPNIAHLYTAFEQSEEELRLSKLNKTLAEQCGREYRVDFHYGNQVNLLDDAVLLDLADCYKNVFNESWGENWTIQSALKEIKACLLPDPERTPVISLLYKDEKIIGFCWAFIIETETLKSENTPFSSSQLKRHESVEVARYWLNEVGKKKRFITIRELGVIKEFRQDKAPFLCLPIFDRAQDSECSVIFFRTKISSKAFKWSLGVGFVPLQFFMVDGLLLMQGSIKYAINLLNGLLGGSKRKSQHMIVSNISRYLCQ
ncbi:MAG: hypothetical protein RQ899_08610 [Pseudomonadales bacterium]|nr:hypothetical protein [Pseudomonadales bacterium]